MNRISLLLIIASMSIACDRTSTSSYLTSPSPAGYQVRLQGDLHGLPRALFVSNVVMAERVGPGEPESFEVFRADQRDVSFRDLYPVEEWISWTVLRFGPAKGRGKPNRLLHVANRSGHKIDRLIIRCEDMFLVFDLDSNANVRVPCRVTDWLSLAGSLEDGSDLEETVLSIPSTSDDQTVSISRDRGFDLSIPQ